MAKTRVSDLAGCDGEKLNDSPPSHFVEEGSPRFPWKTSRTSSPSHRSHPFWRFKTGDLVWAKSDPCTWWPGSIIQIDGSSAHVSFFGCNWDRWFRVSEMRGFMEHYPRISKKSAKLGRKIDLALDYLRRRSMAGLTCHCRESCLEANSHLDEARVAKKMFQPERMLGFVLDTAVCAWVDDSHLVDTASLAGQVNAYREHTLIRSIGESNLYTRIAYQRNYCVNESEEDEEAYNISKGKQEDSPMEISRVRCDALEEDIPEAREFCVLNTMDYTALDFFGDNINENHDLNKSSEDYFLQRVKGDQESPNHTMSKHKEASCMLNTVSFHLLDSLSEVLLDDYPQYISGCDRSVEIDLVVNESKDTCDLRGETRDFSSKIDFSEDLKLGDSRSFADGVDLVKDFSEGQADVSTETESNERAYCSPSSLENPFKLEKDFLETSKGDQEMEQKCELVVQGLVFSVDEEEGRCGGIEPNSIENAHSPASSSENSCFKSAKKILKTSKGDQKMKLTSEISDPAPAFSDESIDEEERCGDIAASTVPKFIENSHFQVFSSANPSFKSEKSFLETSKGDLEMEQKCEMAKAQDVFFSDESVDEEEQRGGFASSTEPKSSGNTHFTAFSSENPYFKLDESMDFLKTLDVNQAMEQKCDISVISSKNEAREAEISGKDDDQVDLCGSIDKRLQPSESPKEDSSNRVDTTTTQTIKGCNINHNKENFSLGCPYWRPFYASPLMRNIDDSIKVVDELDASSTRCLGSSCSSLHMKFPNRVNFPSKQDLEEKFRSVGDLDCSRTVVLPRWRTGRVVFLSRARAMAAYEFARNKKIFGPVEVCLWVDPCDCGWDNKSRGFQGWDSTPAIPTKPRFDTNSSSGIKSCMKKRRRLSECDGMTKVRKVRFLMETS